MLLRGMSSTIARDIRSAPNLITLSRIVLIVLMVPVYFYVSAGTAMIMGVVAGLTDYADGIVARATGSVTRLGAILDQFGDLCFEALVILMLVTRGYFPAWVLFAYLFREFWVSCIRRFMAGERLSIPSSLAGKLKTNFYMWGFLPTFLAMSDTIPSLTVPLTWLGRVGLWLGLLTSYISAIGYTRSFIAGYDGRVVADPKTAGKG